MIKSFSLYNRLIKKNQTGGSLMLIMLIIFIPMMFMIMGVGILMMMKNTGVTTPDFIKLDGKTCIEENLETIENTFIDHENECKIKCKNDTNCNFYYTVGASPEIVGDDYPKLMCVRGAGICTPRNLTAEDPVRPPDLKFYIKKK